MSKQTVVIVHGMGSITEDEFRKEFVDACNDAFALYEKLQGKDVEQCFYIKTFAYNRIFETARGKMVSGSSALKQFISGSKSGKLPSIVESVDSLYSSIKADHFFATHWLDVLIYRLTLFGEDVRIHLANFLLDILEKVDNTSKVHVMGHSLGSSIVHDTLAKLYTDDFDFKKIEAIDKPGKINPNGYKLGSVHLFANVSRVLESFIDVDESIVRPGAGCMHSYYQYLHMLDPIPKVFPFKPSRTNGWLASDVWDTKYHLSETSSITAGNPHALSHYLLDPENSYLFFKETLPDAGLTLNDKKAAIKEYDKLTLESRTRKLEKEFKDMTLSDKAGVDELLAAMTDLKDFLDDIGEQWR